SLELPSSIQPRSAKLLREADQFRTRLSEDFGEAVLDRALVRIARDPSQMADLAPEGAPPPAYAVGVAYPSFRVALVALQAPGSWEAPDLMEVLKHELTHLALAEAVGYHHVPRWFDEGLAIRESDESPYLRTKALWDATIARRLLPLAELDRGFPTDHYEVTEAYAESADFVRFLMRDSDKARFGSLLQRVRAGIAFNRTLEDAYGESDRKLEFEWREELGRRFGIIPLLTGGGVLWVLVTGLGAVAWVKKRRRDKAKLAEWARDEAGIDTLPAVEDTRSPTPLDEASPPRMPSIPIVEHEGQWHILH
ncbi:MAG: peptidase MA family metallohydrolase, partial [Polyangiaceae bacterium]